jgi:hypothetical protein
MTWLEPGCFSGIAQPEGDMVRLDSLIYDGDQIIGQPFRIDLGAQPGAEGGDDCLDVILAAVEAPVDQSLYPPAQGREEGYARQGGEGDGDVRPGCG